MRRSWIVVALVVSAAVNLFLIGAVAGVVALGARLAAQSARGRPGALFWATQNLPQPDRRGVRQMLRGVRDAVKPETERSRALRIEAWSALASPTPNRTAIEQSLAESRQIDIGVRTKVEDGLLDYVLKLPPSERAQFVAGMARALSPPPPRPARR